MKNSLTLYILMIGTSVFSQNLINGDLEGPISLGTFYGTELPGWEYIPFTDPICQSINSSTATVDICGSTGPDQNHGIFGLPQSGNTFVSGSHAGQVNLWHEGIMQSVSGFEIGEEYIISFYQSVVKQSNFIDTSGSWGIYADALLLGYSMETINHSAATNLNLNWEYREIYFTATSTVHMLKFLPIDLDSVTTPDMEDGGLRMGIDNIKIGRTSQLNLINKASNQFNIKCYPNPFLNHFTINIDPSQMESLTLFSFDHKALDINIIKETHQLNINTLNCKPGIYMLKIKMTTGEVITKKMIAL